MGIFMNWCLVPYKVFLTLKRFPDPCLCINKPLARLYGSPSTSTPNWDMTLICFTPKPLFQDGSGQVTGPWGRLELLPMAKLVNIFINIMEKVALGKHTMILFHSDCPQGHSCIIKSALATPLCGRGTVFLIVWHMVAKARFRLAIMVGRCANLPRLMMGGCKWKYFTCFQSLHVHPLCYPFPTIHTYWNTTSVISTILTLASIIYFFLFQPRAWTKMDLLMKENKLLSCQTRLVLT